MSSVRNHSIWFGRASVDFHVVFGDHDNFRIVVRPDLGVEVYAPNGKPLDQVLNRVRTKAEWICRQIRYFERYQPRMPKKRYVSGETFKFLGRQYRLKVVRAREQDVKLAGGYLTVRVDDRAAEHVKVLLLEWYRVHAKAVFEKRLRCCMEKAQIHGIKEPSIRVRRMRSRWGSCRTSDSILLNTELVQAPVHCIDYVILHELCHIRYREHSKQFYRLLTRLMPDWRLRKQKLEDTVHV